MAASSQTLKEAQKLTDLMKKMAAGTAAANEKNITSLAPALTILASLEASADLKGAPEARAALHEAKEALLQHLDSKCPEFVKELLNFEKWATHMADNSVIEYKIPQDMQKLGKPEFKSRGEEYGRVLKAWVQKGGLDKNEGNLH